jgi:hypothetical protein
MPVSVVPVGEKRCRPFLLDVMVFSPESGYKFAVMVEKGCSAENDPIWKLVFDLFKKREDGEFDQIVHVSFRAETEHEQTGVKTIAFDGVSEKQANVLVSEVHPAAKQLEGAAQPTEEQKSALRHAMSKVTTVDL